MAVKELMKPSVFLSQLSADTTIDFWLLREDVEIAKLYVGGATYAEILDFANENY